MNNKIRHTLYSLAGCSIVLTLLLAYPEVSRSRAKARAVLPPTELKSRTTDTVEETVTLSPANLNTWTHFYSWYTPLPYCSRAAETSPVPEKFPGTIVAGFKHRFDKGATVFGCPDGSNTVYRGTVWFDLSDIVKKAPPLHISVKSATLHFNQTVACPGELLVGTADWMKGYPDNTLVPGDSVPLATLPSGFRTSKVPSEVLAGPCEACSLEVETVVNNWVKGEEHGGYPNYGFVFKSMQEADLKYGDADTCVGRYGDFSLTVTYKYDKEPIILVVLPTPTPKKPDIPVGKTGGAFPGGESTALARTNFALASNGGKATASSSAPGYSPSGTIDGDEKGLNFGKDGYWSSATGTFPQWLEVDFSGSKTITEIDLFTIQDNYASPSDPVSGMGFTRYGLTDFNVQFWNESLGSWLPIPGGEVKGNKLVWNQFNFPSAPITTSKIRVECLGSADLFSRIAELEAWSK